MPDSIKLSSRIEKTDFQSKPHIQHPYQLNSPPSSKSSMTASWLSQIKPSMSSSAISHTGVK